MVHCCETVFAYPFFEIAFDRNEKGRQDYEQV